jgi:hypothetical protein
VFEIGAILYLMPCYFKNGNTSKNKYFIVLKNIENRVILASLPTRTNKAPALVLNMHGCNNDIERCFNCYAFEANRIISENAFAFPIQTFMYGNEVEDYDLDILQHNHKIEGVDYEMMGTLIEAEYKDIISCLKQSTSIRRGISKHL